MPPIKKPDEKNPAGDGDDAGGEAPLTREDVQAMVNGALTSHMRRLKADIEKSVGESVAASLTKAQEERAAAEAAASAKAGEKTAKPEDETAKQLKAIQAQLEAERKARLDAEKKSAEVEAKRLRDEERAALTATLRKAGVDEAHLRGALAILHTEDRRVVRKEDGGIGFKTSRQGIEDVVEVEAGVAEWLKTDEGKAYLPARGAAGSGAGRGSAPPAGSSRSTIPTDAEVAEVVRDVIGS